MLHLFKLGYDELYFSSFLGSKKTQNRMIILCNHLIDPGWVMDKTNSDKNVITYLQCNVHFTRDLLFIVLMVIFILLCESFDLYGITKMSSTGLGGSIISMVNIREDL